MSKHTDGLIDQMATESLEHNRAMNQLQRAEQEAKTAKAVSEQRVQELVETHVRRELSERGNLPGSWKGSS